MKHALVVGSGSIAQRHIRNLRKLFPDAEIACVSSSGRHIVASDIGVNFVYESIEAAVLNKPDIAIVASPATHHLEYAKTILKANIPVLIEKPLCVECSELSHFPYDASNRKIAVGYNLRFMPTAIVVKDIIDSGKLGRISTAFAEVGQYLPDWRPDTDYRKGVSAQTRLGGGALLELSHELDYLNWFFGKFSDVSAVMRSSGILDIDVEDSVDALIINHSGVVFHLHLDFLQRKPTRFFKIVGEKSNLIWDLIKNEVLMQGKDSVEEIVFRDPSYDRNEMYVDQLRGFISYAAGNGDGNTTFSSSIEVMRLIEAIRISSSEKKWVKVGAKHE